MKTAPKQAQESQPSGAPAVVVAVSRCGRGVVVVVVRHRYRAVVVRHLVGAGGDTTFDWMWKLGRRYDLRAVDVPWRWDFIYAGFTYVEPTRTGVGVDRDSESEAECFNRTHVH